MMDRDIHGVRISPGVVEFLDTEVGIVHQVEINVKNISSSTKHIRLYAPKLKNFHLRVKQNDRDVASGLCMTAILEYMTDVAVEHTSVMVVTVGDHIIEVPVSAIPAQPILEIGKMVDFGIVGNNTKLIYKYINLTNHGSKPGHFKFEYQGDDPINVIPSSGVVYPKQIEPIKVEFVTKKPGTVNEEVTAMLEDQPPASFKVKVRVVEKCLELLDPESHDLLECIKFGPTYYGSDRTECAVLFNNGPDPVTFVSILEDNVAAQVPGEDLTRSTGSFLANKADEEKALKGELNVLTSMVTSIPNQGYLRPYEKTLLLLRFSPRWYESRKGWKSMDKSAPRRDFALFLKIKIIGASCGFEDNSDNDINVSLAVTGTALPVSVSIEPSKSFSFGQCSIGERADLICTLRNKCSSLPIIYNFHRVAHFTANPTNGRIGAKQHADVVFTFLPRQIGTFTPKQVLDIVGFVADPSRISRVISTVIYTAVLDFSGSSDSVTLVPPPKFNPGITPLITNEVGSNITTRMSDLKTAAPRNAINFEKNSTHTSKNISSNNSLVAYPNDRAASIRPSNRKESYRTIFTKTERHTYVDPDYAFTDEEEEKRLANRQVYQDLINSWNAARMMDKRFVAAVDDVNLGIEPGQGLKPSQIMNLRFVAAVDDVNLGIEPGQGLKPSQIKRCPDDAAIDLIPPNADWQLLSNKELSVTEKTTKRNPAKEGLNAIPDTLDEKKGCARYLSPQELYKVLVGPPVIDFGRVCLRSISTHNLDIVNNLGHHIHVIAEVDCRELRQSSPLSLVVPPMSNAVVPLLFESNTTGAFQRCVYYSINGCYKNHVTVTADVVPVGVEMSTQDIIVRAEYGHTAEAGLRGIVTLHNRLNYPAEFTWVPNVGDRGTAFSMRPASGTVDAFHDLDCEIVWHPSYLAPADGSFSLMVQGGVTTELRCKAQLSEAKVRFLDRRLLFGMIPVNLTSVKKTLLYNPGENHAYFKVVDPNPFPGLQIIPVNGVVPVGGYAELTVALTPDYIIKFDTTVRVALKGSHVITLRMSGSVIEPSVEIDLTVAFTKLEFDLIRYRDFSLNFFASHSSDDLTYQMLNPGMFTVSLEPEQTIEGELVFTPTEVACYDFVMNIMVNDVKALTPNPTPLPPSPAASVRNKLPHIVTPRPKIANIVTPRRHVIATALRQPLHVSTNLMHFKLPYDFSELNMTGGVDNSQQLLLINDSEHDINWKLDVSKPADILDSNVFKFVHSNGLPYVCRDTDNGVTSILKPGEVENMTILFTPSHPGHYECVLPLILDDDNKPYQFLQLIGDQVAPTISFLPKSISLTPVPLCTKTSAEFSITASHYTDPGSLTFQTPQVEFDDSTTGDVFTLTFPNGLDIPANTDPNAAPVTLKGILTFSSSKPVSFSANIIFTDILKQKHQLSVTATADNSILTCYPFLAGHRTDHQIVLNQNGTNDIPETSGLSGETIYLGELMIQPCKTPSHTSRPGTSATSSTFHDTSSFGNTTTTESSYGTRTFSRDGAMNRPQAASEVSMNAKQVTNKMLGSVVFPNESTDEGIFHMEVLLTVQRWFSNLGWPCGPYPINIPESLRRCISKQQTDSDEKAGKRENSEKSVKRESRTIYEMLNHICGKPIPGIPINNSLPADELECAKQIYWQHCTLLVFLKCQGARVASIRPEYLLDPVSYRVWKLLQRELTIETMEHAYIDPQTSQCLHLDILDDEVFDAVSKRAWADLLLQILKCLVIGKITPNALANLRLPNKDHPRPIINPDPLCSNIYSTGERILLAWLNHNYKFYRSAIWKDCKKGGIPPYRWIVNFDYDLLDGLVIAATLGAHMPFLIETHLKHMYSHPDTAEKCLHNALKIISAMTYVGIDYDIQAIDITDPNPIALLLLTAFLFHHLPQYLPKSTITFSSPLHAEVTRQVKLNNRNGRPVTYKVLLAGPDAVEFSIPAGDLITLPLRTIENLAVKFKGRFMRSSEAVLLLIGRRHGAIAASTLVFKLQSYVESIDPQPDNKNAQEIIKVECPCYHMTRIPLNIINTYDQEAEFKVILMESSHIEASEPAKLIKAKPKKKKVIRAKIDNGRKYIPSPIPSDAIVSPEEKKNTPEEEKECYMRAFFTPTETVRIQANGCVTINVHYLPFHMGHRQCSVIFTNDSIGEFLYSIEAEAVLPIPCVLPLVNEPNTKRISSAVAAGEGHGLFGGDDHIIYWKCEVNQILNEHLPISIRNTVKDKALLLAAQQMMSVEELHQRHLTDTLDSTAVCARIMSHLAIDPDALVRKNSTQSGIRFNINVSNSNFITEKSITFPHPDDAQENEDKVYLPISFTSTETGHFPCQVILSAADDIRVFKIECTVNPEGSTAEFDFVSPVDQSVTQSIPITNHSDTDWTLKVTITGDSAFSGSDCFVVRSGETALYRVKFHPAFEADMMATLTLENSEDHSVHKYYLKGRVEEPLPLDTLRLECEANRLMEHTITVPNCTKHKLYYRVESDISFVRGDTVLSVLPGSTNTYKICLGARRRGQFTGMLTFTAGDNPVIEVDSDGDDVPESKLDLHYTGYRVWYNLNILVHPPPPEKAIILSCSCFRAAVIEVVVKNPTNKLLKFDVTRDGNDIHGPESITVPPGGRDLYQLRYVPGTVGEIKGSLVFNNDSIGEFWYELQLTATPPEPTTLTHMECELGKFISQPLVLNNPTKQTLELVAVLSNTNNFKLDRSNDRPLTLSACSSLTLAVNYTPSVIARQQSTTITFYCEQLGQWVFHVSGSGVLPTCAEPMSVCATVNSHSNLMIPFCNPMDDAALISVSIRDQDSFNNHTGDTESAFCLLLNTTHAMRAGPKSLIDIPVSFAPQEMKLYDAVVIVLLSREDGKVIEGYEDSSTPVSEIRWLFPIHGIPEYQPVSESQATVISCKARDRIDERLELVLTGVLPPGQFSPTQCMTRRKKTPPPPSSIPKSSDFLMVNEYLAETDFTYSIQYATPECQSNLNPAVAVSLVRQYRDATTGLVTLHFNVVYAPFKIMDYNVKLVVQAVMGGQWKFPLRFVATEPQVDDEIVIEAVGLDKVSSVAFRLYSQTSHPQMFEAHFLAGSDREFTVTPLCGELLPESSNGTLIQVNFTPVMYGKIHQAKLVVQTRDMQWSYIVHGIIPDYTAPRGQSSKPIAGPHQDPRHRSKPIKYIRENMKLATTAVSSPIKGASLIKRLKATV